MQRERRGRGCGVRKVVKLRVDKGRDRDKQRQGVEQGPGGCKGALKCTTRAVDSYSKTTGLRSSGHHP